MFFSNKFSYPVQHRVADLLHAYGMPLTFLAPGLDVEYIEQLQGELADLARCGLQVLGARVLRDYQLGGLVATGGVNGVWKIYAARSKKEGGLV